MPATGRTLGLCIAPGTRSEVNMEAKRAKYSIRPRTRMIVLEAAPAAPKRPWSFTILGERKSRRIPRGRVRVAIAPRK